MSEKIPPEKLDHPNETWDEYEKRIKAKYGNKYDEYFRVVEGLTLFLEENTKAFMDMSPEEQKAYLERDRKKEADERLKESGDRWIKIMAELKDKLEEVKASSQSEEESDYDEGKTPPLEEEF
tara:strand:+ start:1136 stop:1504 length:369 start_codon:yes stop_codon:yes gene_type:complete